MNVSCAITRTCNDITGSDNLFLSWHEDQDVSLRWLEVDLYGLLHGTLHIVLTVVARVKDIHWERAARDGEDRDIPKERGKLVGIHSG